MKSLLAALALSGALVLPALAEQAQRVDACSLLTREEVKKLAPWPDFLDQMWVKEERSAGGASCNYPSVYIQIMPMPESGWTRWLEGFKKGSPLEPIADVGDEAYLRDNRGHSAELLSKVGTRAFTVQLSLNGAQTTQSVKPNVVALGKALAAKLR